MGDIDQFIIGKSSNIDNMMSTSSVLTDMKAVNGATLQLQSLQLEFSNTLAEYQQAYVSYVDILQNPTSVNSVTTIPNSYFMPTTGENGSYAAYASDVSTCQAICSSNSAYCKGATYVGNEQVCQVFGNEGTAKLVSSVQPVSLAESYDTMGLSTVISVLPYYVNLLKTLNDRLIDLNQQISKITQNIEPNVQNEIDVKNQEQGKLLETYWELMRERKAIDLLSTETKFIKKEHQDYTLYTVQNNMRYIIWTILAIVFICIMIKLIFFPTLKVNWVSTLFGTFMATIVLFLTIYLSSPVAFMMWLSLIVIVLLIKFKLFL